MDIINSGISFYFFLLLTVFGAFSLAGRRKVFPPYALKFMAAWFLLPFVVGSFAKMKELRYMFPLFPVYGVLIAALLVTALRDVKPKMQVAVWALLVLCPVYQFIIFSFDLTLLPRSDLRWGPFVISIKDLEMVSVQPRPTYTYPANPAKWPTDEVVKIIQTHSHHITDPFAQVLFPDRNLYLNVATLSYQTALNQANIQWLSDGISSAHFMVKLTGPGGRYGPLDFRNPDMQKMLNEQRLPFLEIERVRLPDQTEAIIYKRMRLPGSPTSNLLSATE